ncbi:MAG: cupin domain-containing protein [Clostridiales bacterium]|jgi:quercetin dioxygenase-like cupin family protein|nr:cupin domain-containing protein [Clostridiales bacterium]
MIAPDDVYHLPLMNTVTFEPGARSYWHSHDGMLVLGVGGIGYYQEGGKPAQIIRKGDVVEIAPGSKHWHGATPDNWFSQMAIMVDSGYSGAPHSEPVADEHYAGMETEEYVGRVVTADNEFMFQRADEPVTMPTFTGPVYLSSVVAGGNALGAPDMHYVVFEPGVINNWHIHAGGQALIATDGIGYHQIEGQPVEVLYPGDVALCPPGVKHWHGGSADTRFAHIAINTNPEAGGVEWLEPVSQEEYALLTTEKTDEREGGKE